MSDKEIALELVKMVSSSFESGMKTFDSKEKYDEATSLLEELYIRYYNMVHSLGNEIK